MITWGHLYSLHLPLFTNYVSFFFKGVDVKFFHCDVCEFIKHKRVSFPASNKRSSIHFYLVHIDTWGPSTIPNVKGSR